MALQRWMTRFQLTGNRLIESSMDLLTDLEVTSPEAIAHVAQRRQAHEAEQVNQAGIAEATPGTAAHVNVPCTEEMALAAFVQFNANRRTQHRMAFPLGGNLSALIFVSLADLTQGQRNTLTHKYHDTSWKNIRSVQCARAQRLIPGSALRYENSS